MATRKLAIAFCVEGNFDRMEKRPAEAASKYMAAIRLGAVLAHGGLMIDGMIATACEVQGENSLASIVQGLDAKECRKFIADLDQAQAQEEPVDQILNRERKWAAAQTRTFEGLKRVFGEIIETRSLDPSKAARTVFRRQYEHRLRFGLALKAKLAARASTLEKGQFPASWRDMVPNYLKGIPDVTFGPNDTNQLKFTESHGPLPF